MKKKMPQKGCVKWIGVRPSKRAELNVINSVKVSIENGLEGDHYKKSDKKRQITLIQAEHIDTVASIMDTIWLSPSLLRRNIVVSGINLLALGDKMFQIGEDVVLKMTGPCRPCSRMEENLGEGGYNAMCGHGGITATVIKGGIIRNRDEVKLVD